MDIQGDFLLSSDIGDGLVQILEEFLLNLGFFVKK